MDTLNLNLDPDLFYANLQGFPDEFLTLNDIFSSSSRMAGYSVHRHDSSLDEYFNQEVTNQEPPYPRSLNDFSISHLPFAENASAHFSQLPPRPVAVVRPLNKNTQQPGHTVTSGFTGTESSSSDEPQPPAPEVASASEKRKTNKAKKQTKYVASEKAKLRRARYLRSEKGKESKARYASSAKGRASQARYYLSDTRKESMAKYKASDKAKAYRAIRNARSNTYKSAIRKGFSEKLAREKGELAAKAKRAELSSVLPLATVNSTD
ncbi:hypothetical protein [Endozoicomonas acroporae]|uniref:hypothetical protein n=1 Tax=Endozoicomonas acroporae TaxID=1701104 RepID=UPI003D78D997